jgi:hypothetical protein
MVREIGRVIRFAYLEQYLQHIIYMLRGTPAGIGRVAVRESGRLVDRLELVLDLVAAKGWQPNPPGFRAAAALLKNGDAGRGATYRAND